MGNSSLLPNPTEVRFIELSHRRWDRRDLPPFLCAVTHYYTTTATKRDRTSKTASSSDLMPGRDYFSFWHQSAIPVMIPSVGVLQIGRTEAGDRRWSRRMPAVPNQFPSATLLPGVPSHKNTQQISNYSISVPQEYNNSRDRIYIYIHCRSSDRVPAPRPSKRSLSSS